jgi:isoquinoline 1-oxidoreductase alpha subunit
VIVMSVMNDTTSIDLVVNEEKRRVEADPDTPLLWVLRDHLGLTGTKFGCGMAVCGACTVHVDGEAVRSCVTRVEEVAGARVTTIEGLDGLARAVQDAWVAVGVPQCGYCQSGQIMSAVAMLRANPNPSDEDIDAVLSANICRCGTYPRIRRAIRIAVQTLAGRKP